MSEIEQPIAVQENAPKKRKERRAKRKAETVPEDVDPDVEQQTKPKKQKKLSLKKLYPVKGPRTAFQLYVKEQAKLHNENENNQPKFNATQIQPKWKTISAEEKEKFTKLAKVDLVRWLKEIHEEHSHEFTPAEQIKYYEELKSIGYPVKTPEENQRIINKDKKPNPPFFLFSEYTKNQIKKANGGELGMNNQEFRELVGSKWKAMNDSEKDPWKKKSKMLHAQMTGEQAAPPAAPAPA